MCGIVGAIAQRNITPILLEGLRRLEYRGYDSAGLALLAPIGPANQNSPINKLKRCRAVGKVIELENALEAEPLSGHIGIAHTRWATHGKPTVENAHPHLSAEQVAVVHNGIIENFETLKHQLNAQGYQFTSDTDTEVIAHLFDAQYKLQGDVLTAFRSTLEQLHGAYALGLIHLSEPDNLYCARMGSPLVIGEGSEEHFIASDPLALLQVTDRFRYLEEGDHARLGINHIEIWNQAGQVCTDHRPVQRYEHGDQAASLGEYRHYMEKEIHEQPKVIQQTLEGKLSDDNKLLPAILGPEAEAVLPTVAHIHIIACGTSYHAGLVAKYWLEALAGIPTAVEVASEYRYREVAIPANTLLISISQSGETADTLAALRFAKKHGYLSSLAICNVPGSSLVRESALRLLTQAGPEIGVASTKAFTTQLVALLWLAGVMAKLHRSAQFTLEKEKKLVQALRHLPDLVQKVLALEGKIESLATRFANRQHSLFLGRGVHYPIAMEGALKLKEISYIHAEAYAAGELKHGPLALVDDEMPVVTVAPNDNLLEKLKSNLQEVRARGGQLINFVCEHAGLEDSEGITNIKLPRVDELTAPILFIVPLQLLAYHVALVKGTDVDKPRNLAKSVTVE